MDNFIAWLSAEGEKRYWSLPEIAQRIGISRLELTRIAKGQMRPSVDLCRRVALVLKVPEEEVLRRAGLLPSGPPSRPEEEATWEEAARLFRQLSPGQRDMLLAFVRAMLIEEEERKQSLGTSSNAPSYSE